MKTFSIRNSGSATAVMVQAFDFLAVCAGGWLSYQLRFSGSLQVVEMQSGDRMLVLGMAVFSALFFGKIYRLWPGGSLGAMLGRVTIGWVATWVLLIVLLAMTKNMEAFSRLWLTSMLGLTTVTLWMGRATAFCVMARMRRAGYLHKTVVLYGDTKTITAVRQRIKNATWSGYDIVATVLHGDQTDLAALDARLKPDEIWIGLAMADQAQLQDITHALSQSVANIRLLPDLMMYQILNHGMTVTLGIPMVDISVSPMFGGRRVAKALLDYAVASVALLLLSPLLIGIAIAVKLTSKGPVLFKQRRHGWNDEVIYVYKFRSMTVHQEVYGSTTQASRQDSRVTPLGRFLRKTSLDELPQFINVLQGRMSVVGPRPHALNHNREYLKLIPRYALRHKVKPGITGWAQVSGFRGETDTLDKMENRVKCDIYYLENWSLWMVLKIIFMTPLATIQNKNVY